MPTEKSALRTFTLSQLRESISVELGRQGSESPNAPSAPSLPTLKNWSRSGVFKSAVTLQTATRLAMAHMAVNAKYYSRQTSKANKGPVGLGQQAGAAVNDAQADQILLEVRALAQRIEGLEQALEKPRHLAAEPAAAAQAPSEDIKKVAAAIDQLDSVRRHLMLRFDNELQLIRQAGSAQGKSMESVGGIDSHRILAKLSSIEQMLVAMRHSNFQAEQP